MKILYQSPSPSPPGIAPRLFFPLCLLLFQTLFATAAAPVEKTGGRVTIDFNPSWLFWKGDNACARQLRFDESGGDTVCLPHANTLVSHANIDTSAFAFISWYRKHYTPPPAFKGKRFLLCFEGISKAAELFVNGERIGEHLGAYTPFRFDITDHLIVGSDNAIAVRVDSRQRMDIPPEGKNLDFMLFGGIVRDVSLTVVDPLYLDDVYARLDTAAATRILIETSLVNANGRYRNCSVTTRLVDARGAVVARTTVPAGVSAHSKKTFRYTAGPIETPHRWHPDTPYLYTIRTELTDGSRTIDTSSIRFGIRTFAFTSTGAFTINNTPLRLRGLNRHETFPFIGRAASNRLQARDAEIIKYDFGCNIVRCSHYPQDPAFLDRCDKIGLLVLEEMAGWLWVSSDSSWKKIALQNLEEMIRRDRNRASILSYGVRINQSADFHKFYKETNRIARALDPSRLTFGARVLERGSTQEFMEDIWAQNFMIPSATPPVLPWITTEYVGHWLPTHSWDHTALLCGHALVHAAMLDSAFKNPAIAGILGWCAFDYNSTYQYAQHSICYHGVADLFRQPKPAAFVYQSQRDPAIYGPMAYILNDWSGAVASNEVWVASNCDSIELVVNGRSRGKKASRLHRSLPHPLFKWENIPFRKGELKALGFRHGRVVATHVRRTPDKPVRLEAIAEDTLLETGGDMTRVLVSAVDSRGEPVPRISVPVTISVTGAADFNGKSPIPLENGRTAFFIKTRSFTTGTVICSAESAGLKPAVTRITVRGSRVRN